ncbi:hypothetical protein BO79DRAFT_259703 [Aspergillus costaricaensis CBS 115574]|uniref:Uncharacterized protein n=1 Tax=Aspergillus costaricaensis CBS 115574 TaxID=1448317 RepID=A0ACD1I0C9_9EURO|nr:hypothetical protein BO79DRAFT_259703 [Aspergillus costaricaensis CBS 115574]RAK84014.1 hypothetical protein BO79DRAFT_259703 [Aspergillus costaricaensis CBS 115574]
METLSPTKASTIKYNLAAAYVQASGNILQNSAFSGSTLETLAESLVSRACSTSSSLDFQKILQKKRYQRDRGSIPP